MELQSQNYNDVLKKFSNFPTNSASYSNVFFFLQIKENQNVFSLLIKLQLRERGAAASAWWLFAYMLGHDKFDIYIF